MERWRALPADCHREEYFAVLRDAMAEYYLAESAGPYQQSGRSSGAPSAFPRESFVIQWVTNRPLRQLWGYLARRAVLTPSANAATISRMPMSATPGASSSYAATRRRAMPMAAMPSVVARLAKKGFFMRSPFKD